MRTLAHMHWPLSIHCGMEGGRAAPDCRSF